MLGNMTHSDLSSDILLCWGLDGMAAGERYVCRRLSRVLMDKMGCHL